MTVLGIREARPAQLAAGHGRAQHEVFQGGALGTVVFRAAAIRTVARSSVGGICRRNRLVNFRLEMLFGRFWSPAFLRRSRNRCGLLLRFQ